jgi:hypothetical protein
MLAPNYKSSYLKVFNHCTSLQDGRFRFRIPVAAKIIIVFKTFKVAVRSTQLRIE